MKLSTKYILFVVLLHLVTLVLTWFIFDTNKLFFIGAEALIIISMVVAVSLYNQLIKPLKYLSQGVEAIKDRDFNVKFLNTGQHEVDQLVDVYNQMIDELRDERTRQEQQHFFLEKLIHTSPTGIIILDYDNRVEHLNPKALQILSVTPAQVTGQLIADLPHGLFKQIGTMEIGGSATFKPDGMNTYKLQKAHFIDRGFARQFVMIEELTAELLAAEKNVYGKVIRMMAHEVNNTIGPVNSILQSALTSNQLWETHKFNTLKDALQVAMDRNQNLNLFMRNFAELVKLPAPKLHPVNICKIIYAVARLMEINAKDRKITFKFNLPVGSFIIAGDEQLLEQALINIVRNSLEAIHQQGTVTFTLPTAKKILEITDTGHGISAENSPNLFSPFFSTKKDGQGIGLTLVREILLSHGFEFSLKANNEGLTVFSICF